MFFEVSNSVNSRFPHHHFLKNNFVLNVDAGWQTKQIQDTFYVYKGYCDDNLLEDILSMDKNYHGNFCIFEYDYSSCCLYLHTNIWRSFNIFYEPGKWFSNLIKSENQIYADAKLKLNSALEFTTDQIDIIGVVGEQKNYDSVVEYSYNKLYNKIEKFLQVNNLPVKCFLSGGVDSATVYSFVSTLTDDFEHVFNETVEWDYFYCNNFDHLRKNFWSYKQIHHWNQACVLTSGAPGDEYTLRNPVMLDIWLTWHGSSLEEYAKTSGDYNQSEYFNRYVSKLKNDNHHQQTIEQCKSLDKKSFCKKMCSIVANDAQHWHLGNTLTFTPLRDLEIFKAIFMLDPDQLKSHIVDADFQKKLISKNNPDILSYLSNKKNTGETYKNIFKLMQKVSS